MHVNRQELFSGVFSSANRRMRRARRTSERLLASALGFGVAYYLDAENGELRRRKAQQWLGRTARRLDSVFDSEAGDPPPVFHPTLRGLTEHHRAGRTVGSAAR
jgi:hypothetical protein